MCPVFGWVITFYYSRYNKLIFLCITKCIFEWSPSLPPLFFIIIILFTKIQAIFPILYIRCLMEFERQNFEIKNFIICLFTLLTRWANKSDSEATIVQISFERSSIKLWKSFGNIILITSLKLNLFIFIHCTQKTRIFFGKYCYFHTWYAKH